MRLSSKFAGFALLLVTSVRKGKKRTRLVAARAKMVGLAPPWCCRLLLDNGVGDRGWGCVSLHRVAPVALPRGSRIRSVMGRLQPVASRTAVRRLQHTLATGDQPSFGVNDKPWVVLAVGNQLVVAGGCDEVGMRRCRSRAKHRQHRRHEQGYRSQ